MGKITIEEELYISYVKECIKQNIVPLGFTQMHGEPSELGEMTNDKIGSILLNMYKVNKAKRKDYTGDRGIFANFIESGDQVHISAGSGIEYMIATKQSRLKGLLKPGADAPSNESVEDTLLDRAVYSVIALAAYKEGLY